MLGLTRKYVESRMRMNRAVPNCTSVKQWFEEFGFVFVAMCCVFVVLFLIWFKFWSSTTLCMVGDDLVMKEFEKLKKELSFGKWNRESGAFGGRDITRIEDNGFRISQQVDGLEEITVHDMVGPRFFQKRT